MNTHYHYHVVEWLGWEKEVILPSKKECIKKILQHSASSHSWWPCHQEDCVDVIDGFVTKVVKAIKELCRTLKFEKRKKD